MCSHFYLQVKTSKPSHVFVISTFYPVKLFVFSYHSVLAAGPNKSPSNVRKNVFIIVNDIVFIFLVLIGSSLRKENFISVVNGDDFFHGP